MDSPFLFSVVIINWNAGNYLPGCVDSVLESSYPNLEVIVVDNASTDRSIDELKAHLGQKASLIKLIVNEMNYGAAHALNIGVKNSTGEYVAFIASDTKVDKNCFLELAKVLSADASIGAAESKLLLMDEPGRFDHAGEFLNQFGLLMQRHAGQELDKGQFDYITEIFSAKGTALTVKRDVFERAGGFDRDYFMFLEETDLCWRIWLSGHRIVFIPEAKIYHASGVSVRSHKRSSYLVKYYGSRNYITTLIKNLGIKNLLKILPLQVSMWFLLALWFILRSRAKEGFYILKGILSNIINLKMILKKRRIIQASRKVSDNLLFEKVMKKVSFSYLLDRVNMW